jgi:hypothetical protein
VARVCDASEPAARSEPAAGLTSPCGPASGRQPSCLLHRERGGVTAVGRQRTSSC